MQKSDVAANTQVTEVDIAYLAGLWDGEGHIGVTFHQRQSGKMEYRAVAGIVNGNTHIIARAVEILDGLEISARIEPRGKKKAFHTQTYNVIVNKHHALKKLAETLIPYLHGKRAVAKLVLRFVNSRLRHGKKTADYTDEEISLGEQLKRLNRRGTSEAIRETEIKDMVHTL